MPRTVLTAVFATLTAISAVRTPAAEPASPEKAFRPPSVPLVTHDPYFSIWSPADKLTDAATVQVTYVTGRDSTFRSSGSSGDMKVSVSLICSVWNS